MSCRRLRIAALAAVAMLAGGCTGSIADPETGGSPADPVLPPFAPASGNLHRLTVAQYHNTVRDLLGEDVTVPADLQEIAPLNGFIAIGASRTTVSPIEVEQYETAAYDLAAQVLRDPARRGRIVTCTPSGIADDACAGEAIAAFGAKAWRRPLAADEVARYVAIASRAATTLGDFHAGLEFAIAGLLQSPHFLFRVELGEPEGDRRRYTDHEMASRISYFLWNTTPDDALLAAAQRGELRTEEQVREQAQRLLDSPRANDAMRNFFTELLDLGGLDNLSKDTGVFPLYTDTLRAAMREETVRTLTWLTFEEDRSWGEAFSTRTTFVNGELAALYGLPAPAGEWGRAEHPADGMRQGILGHAGLLALHSHANETSATRRGQFVRQVLLCHSIPPPPPTVVTMLPEPSASARTARERLEEHRTNPLCAGCHQRMDPIGLSLENFDGIGVWRDSDNGAPIDPSGDLDGIPFADARELGGILAEHPDVAPCVVKKMYRYATGHIETTGEQRTLAALTESFLASGQSLRDLVIEIVASDGFRYAGEPR